MSRRDTYHDVVKQELIRDGWIITHDPYVFKSDPELSTDIGAERTLGAEKDQEKIAIEVKSFLQVSQVSELEKAIGQYELYTWLLEGQEPERALYLAVPIHAFEGIFSKQVGHMAIKKLHLKLIVFSKSGEENLQWITS